MDSEEAVGLLVRCGVSGGDWVGDVDGTIVGDGTMLGFVLGGLLGVGVPGEVVDVAPHETISNAAADMSASRLIRSS